MVRKLVILMTAGFLIITPITANALGFGVVKLNSALNERFDAEIEVLSPTSEDIKSLNIKLAGQAAFLRSGIERTALYSSLLFEVKQRSNDTYYIQLTSKGTIREPFLNFLLEMSWKNGRMLREYTVLLDPPGQYSAQQQVPQPVVIETPAVAEPAAVMKAPLADPFVAAPVAKKDIELAEGEQFPRVELSKYKEKDSKRVEQQATMKKVDEPKLEPLPEPELEALPEPELESVSSSKPTPLPEPVQQEAQPESAPMAVDMVEESKPFDEEQLFPTIPLRAYSDDNEYLEATEEPTEPTAEPTELMGGDLDYGITAKNDNLWNIAERMRPSADVSIYQVMMALVQANPDAFIEGNVHRLKVGHVLRIDDPALFSAMSKQQAANEFMSQTRDWDEFRNVATDSIEEQPVIATQVESETVVAEPAEKGELILATPESSELKSGTGVSEEAISNDLATLKAELSQMQEQADAEGGKNEGLNSRIRQIEEKLADAQRILSVQDDELAVLQKQLSETKIESVSEPVVEATTETETETEAAAVTEEAVVAEEAPVVDAVTGPAATSEVAESESPVELAERIAEEEKAKPAPAMVEGVMDMVMGWVGKAGDMASGIGAALGGVLGSMMMYIIIGVVVLFIILFFIIFKRRKQGDDFEESILKGTSSGTTSSSDVPSANLATSEESSFLSDFAVSGAGAIQTEDSEVDPLTEADVFIAYGRHEAAEERLQEAIQLEPERDELKLKLLELYSTTKNTSGFESIAEAIHASLDGLTDGNPTWDKVVALGKPLLPDNPLFNSGGTVEADAFAAPVEENNVELSDSQVLDIGLETGGFSSSDFNLDLGNSSTEEEQTDDSIDLDFDLDLGDASVTEEATAVEEVASMDFNLDESDTASDAGLDFNLDLDAGTVEETTKTDSDTATMDFDGGLDFALNEAEPNAIDLGVDESDSTDFEITSDGDEVGTKLDLAKAYIDMGDPEGARSILDEVLDEGNDQQKTEAEQLIQQIA